MDSCYLFAQFLHGRFTEVETIIYHFPFASKETLKDMSKIYMHEISTKLNKAWALCIIHGMYCILNISVLPEAGIKGRDK